MTEFGRPRVILHRPVRILSVGLVRASDHSCNNAFADAHGLPSGDRIRGQPHGDIAALDQRSVVCRPIPDVVFCLVLWVHSRLHVEIMHLLSPRWPGGRSWLTEGAGSVHQRPGRRPFTCTVYPACACSWLGSQPCAPASEPSPEPATAQPERGARLQPGTQLGIYLPEQHDLYDGRFIITGQRVYQVGTLSDASPWDHMGNDASTVREVGGTIEIDVDEINNAGTFRAELELPEGTYVVEMDQVVEFQPVPGRRHRRVHLRARGCRVW